MHRLTTIVNSVWSPQQGINQGAYLEADSCFGLLGILQRSADVQSIQKTLSSVDKLQDQLSWLGVGPGQCFSIDNLWQSHAFAIVIPCIYVPTKFDNEKPVNTTLCVFKLQTGKAALHLAAERGHLEVAQELLEHKAYVNAKTKVTHVWVKLIHYPKRLFPLAPKNSKYSYVFFFELCQIFIFFIDIVHCEWYLFSLSLLLKKVGLTPLHLAAESGHKELVGLLVSRYQASVDALTLVRS